jgi:leukotriene-A4 hydrolase
LYRLSTTSNAEIRFRFYEIALADPSSDAAKQFANEAAKWVVGGDGTGVVKGRMKFCRPTFRAIAKVDKSLAVETFTPNRSAFHPIAAKLIEKVSAGCLMEEAFCFLITTDDCHLQDLGIAA